MFFTFSRLCELTGVASSRWQTCYCHSVSHCFLLPVLPVSSNFSFFFPAHIFLHQHDSGRISSSTFLISQKSSCLPAQFTFYPHQKHFLSCASCHSCSGCITALTRYKKTGFDLKDDVLNTAAPNVHTCAIFIPTVQLSWQ